MSVCSGWNVQQMNAVKPPVSSCSCRSALEVFDALGERLDVAEHHGAGRAAAELVPDAVDFEPVVGQHLAARDRLADAVDEDLAAAAGQAAQPGVLQPLAAPSRSGSLLILWKCQISGGLKACMLTCGKCALRSRSSSSYHSSFSVGCMPPCIRI